MSEGEAALAARLQHTKRMASGLLAAMAVLFVVTSLLRAEYPWLDVAWAFSEAALIGGLADWFAVTALFRHPMGLPIPHTAIVPTRKNEIGRRLGRFVSDHFLVREAISRRLDRTDLAAGLGAWLEREGNARRLCRDASAALDWLIRDVDSSRLREGFRLSLTDTLKGISVHRALATLIDVLATGDRTRALVDQLVEFGRDQLENNKAAIRDRIRQRSPWWLPRFVDEGVYDQLVGEFERILDEVAANPSHPARMQFNDRLRTLKHRLAHDDALIEKSRSLHKDLLEHPEVRRFVSDIAQRVRLFLQEALNDPDSALRLGVERELHAVGSTLNADPELRARLNDWLAQLLIFVAENYRHSLSEIIAETIEEWDAASTAGRIELHIGRDLQFIRINGTLVGGLVGVTLYFGWQALTLAL